MLVSAAAATPKLSSVVCVAAVYLGHFTGPGREARNLICLVRAHPQHISIASMVCSIPSYTCSWWYVLVGLSSANSQLVSVPLLGIESVATSQYMGLCKSGHSMYVGVWEAVLGWLMLWFIGYCVYTLRLLLIASTNFSVFALRVLAYTNFSDFLCLHNVIMSAKPSAEFICRHYTMHCLTFEQQVPRTYAHTLIYTAHARTSASLPSRASPVSRLFHTGCTSS